MANPDYSPYLEYAPTFRWGGREYGSGANSRAALIKKLGGPKKYDKWARRHRIAAKSFDPTEASVYSQVQPVITGIEAEKKKRAEYYDHMMRNLAGFTTALGPMLGQIGPAIGGAYSDAANAIGAAGEGYGAQMNMEQAANAVAVNSTLSNIHAPEGQMLGGGDAGGVLAGLAGWIPKTMLGAQGSAFAAAAGQLPKSAGLESQLMMKGIIDKAMGEEDDYSTSIQELLQKVPGLRQEAKTAQQKNAQLAQQMRLKQLEAERDWFLDQSKLALSLGKYGLSQQYATMAQSRVDLANNSSKGLDSDGKVKPGYHRDPAGNVLKDGWKMGKGGVPVKVGGGKGASTSSTVPGTPAYRAKALKEVGAARSKIDKTLKGLTKPGTLETDMKPILPDWNTAYQTLYDAYKYLVLPEVPATKARLDQVIRAALAAAGIKPGGGGSSERGH